MNLESRIAQRIQSIEESKKSLPIKELQKRVEELLKNGNKEELEQARADLQEAERIEQLEIDFLLQSVPYIREYTCPLNSQGETTTSGGGLDAFVTVRSRPNRSVVLQRFVSEVENPDIDALPEFMRTDDEPRLKNEMVCENCDTSMLFHSRESTVVCPECGLCREYMEMTQRNLTYDQEVNQEKVTQFSYLRQNHFVEWLNSLAAREGSEIPTEVIDALKSELKKARVTRAKDITPARVRSYLKKLSLQKYYEHVHFLVNLLSGLPPPNITRQTEQKFRQMFQDIQIPFATHAPTTIPKRRNFLSYSYTIHQFAVLLGEDHLLPYLTLLKSTEKLYAQDCLWRKICADLQWEFHPTV